MPKTIVNDLRSLKKSTIARNARRSQKWLQNKIKKADPDSLTTLPKLGKMYLFTYSAKGFAEGTLPFYDRNPLIFVIKRKGKYFHGLNLHYLPPRVRLIFLNKLMDFATNKKLNDKTRLKLTYNLLKNASKMKVFKATFKMYLFPRLKSKFAEIPADQWAFVVSLPLAKFVGATKAEVYKDSKEKYT